MASYGFHFSSVLVGVAGALTAGCAPKPERPAQAPGTDSAGGPVAVVTDRTSYRAGDPIELTIVNRSGDTLWFNPCTRTLERETDGAWEPLEEADRLCTMEAWVLAPGETSARTELPAEMPAGRYRVVLAFTAEGRAGGGTRLTARSAPVTVQP